MKKYKIVTPLKLIIPLLGDFLQKISGLSAGLGPRRAQFEEKITGLGLRNELPRVCAPSAHIFDHFFRCEQMVGLGEWVATDLKGNAIGKEKLFIKFVCD